MAAVQLAYGQQIQRCHEQSIPRGKRGGMQQDHPFEGEMTEPDPTDEFHYCRRAKVDCDRPLAARWGHALREIDSHGKHGNRDKAPGKRPPSAYDLIGIEEGETDPERIQDAAAERIEEIRKLTLGPQREHASALLTEIAQALVSLLQAVGANTAEGEEPPILAELVPEADQLN